MRERINGCRAASPGKAPTRVWWWFDPTVTVAANTKSEARAMIKRWYGLDRIPAGQKVREM